MILYNDITCDTEKYSKFNAAYVFKYTLPYYAYYRHLKKKHETAAPKMGKNSIVSVVC